MWFKTSDVKTAILGYTPNPVEPLKFPESTSECLKSLKETVTGTLSTFSKLQPDKTKQDENYKLCGELEAQFKVAHERLTEMRAAQAVGRVRDGVRRRLEVEKGEFERVRRGVLRAEEVLGLRGD